MVLTQNWPGLVVHMQSRGIACVAEDEHHRWIEVQAGEPWPEFVATCLDRGWHGLENLAAIPGTVGAAPVQNIGAYGLEVADRLDAVQVFDSETTQIAWWPKADCGFAYRDSYFKSAIAGRYLITALRFCLAKSWVPCITYPDIKKYFVAHHISSATPAELFKAVVTIRADKLPSPDNAPNVGSFFKNPVVSRSQYENLLLRYPQLIAFALADNQYKLAAAWLIDACGWRGRAFENVGVHDRQALVLINLGQASAQNVLALANAIRTDVQARFGVHLQIEPRII